MADPGIDRQKVPEHAGRDPIGHEGGQVGLELIELRRRSAARWPLDSGLHRAATGTAEAWQTQRDLAERGGDLARAVILDLTHGRAQLGRRVASSRHWAATTSCWMRSCLPCDRVTPRAAMSPGSLRPTISSTSTLRLEPSIPVSTRRKTNFILIPQPLKHTAGHSLPSTTPPFL